MHNPSDPVGGFAGLPRNITALGELLRGAGYATAYVGKWDAGLATWDHSEAPRRPRQSPVPRTWCLEW